MPSLLNCFVNAPINDWSYTNNPSLSMAATTNDLFSRRVSFVQSFPGASNCGPGAEDMINTQNGKSFFTSNIFLSTGSFCNIKSSIVSLPFDDNLVKRSLNCLNARFEIISRLST